MAAARCSAVLRLSRIRFSNAVRPSPAQLARRYVDLDVELTELGHEIRVGDLTQYGGVAHHRIADRVDEVELDLQAGHRRLGLECRLGQHAREHVEVAADLVPVAGPVGPAERLECHVSTHETLPSPVAPVRCPPRHALYLAYAQVGYDAPARSDTHIATSPRKWATKRSCSAAGYVVRTVSTSSASKSAEPTQSYTRSST